MTSCCFEDGIVNPDTLESLNLGYAKDKNNVYRDREISGENPSKF